MNKKISTIGLSVLAAAVLLSTPNSGICADIANSDGAGTAINAIGTPAFNFQVSPQVQIQGITDANMFAVAAVHTGSFDKENGEAYAMGSENSGLYVQNLKDIELTDGNEPIATAGTIPAEYVLPGS